MAADGMCTEARFIAASFRLACSNCYADDRPLKTCSRCHRASYCSVACQKEHWSMHKEHCRRFTLMMDLLKGTNEPMRCGLDRTAMVRTAMLSTGPNADEGLFRLFLYGPTCAVCYKNPFHFGQTNVKDWKRCTTCQFGWCCSQAHWETYRPRHTEEVCKRYQNCIADEKFLFEHWKRDKEPFAYCPLDVHPSLQKSFPTSWDAYFRWREHRLYVKNRHRLPINFFRCATDYLSQICTVLYGMDRILSFPQVRTYSTLHLHVIGASGYEFPASCSWEEIMHIFPNLQEFQVTFIGPDIRVEGNLAGCSNLETCPDCEAKGRMRKQAFFSGLYHEYHTSSHFKPPDVCVAFNTGMHEEYTQSWETTLHVLLEMNVPCIFTSFDANEAQKDCDLLLNLQAKMIDEPHYNPFSSQYLQLDMVETDKFYQKNMHVLLFQGRQSL